MKDLIRGAEHIVCPTCSKKATREGAQDACDFYKCENDHITVIKIGAKREIWGESLT